MTSNTTMPGTVQIDNGIIRLNTPRNLDWDYTHEAKWYNIFPTKLHQPAWRYMSSGTGRRVNPSPVATESWGGNTDPAYPTAVSGVGTRFTDGESRLLFEAGFKGETDGGGERHLVYGTTFVPGDKLKWVHPRPYEEPEVLTSAVKRALETFQASSRLCDTRVGQYLEGRLGQALTEACKGQDIQVVRVVPDDYSRLGLVKGHRICTIREHGHHCGHVWVGDEASKRTAPSYFRQLHVPGDPADTLSDDPNVPPNPLPPNPLTP
ncbi:uncharacterized protein MKK02DRAFT_30771 [Dioszegia hungarica]|uniref:Uncharacterized protein n=1 Tax=Dioszegia hungarica TaxID=4972 RepID=A0AA38H0P9_9TREE|nr:uncharacterized protein MKK02DRAFT_30771 [Dioszegia hungarica]KAI9631765.1 hypothetical protein MKK02DRAFT_30771 [Dioszegia hungarica]